MKRLLLAFQFLTVIPVKVGGEITAEEIAGSAAFFPLVGAFQGLTAALSAFLLMKVLPPDISAGLALLILILSNGGFDLDGLADTSDGLAVKSSGNAAKDLDRRLLAMKDSATGAMGVIALAMTLLLKFVLMSRFLSDFTVMQACAVFFLMPAFSKWVTVPAMYHSSSARKDGLGKIFIEHSELGHVIVATALVAVLSLAVSALHLFGISLAREAAFWAFSCAAFYLFVLLAVKFLKSRFGGLTGDHFGALTEISEILFLLGAYLWLRPSIS